MIIDQRTEVAFSSVDHHWANHLLIFLLLLQTTGELSFSSLHELACEAAAVSSLLQLRQPASSTPVGLSGTETEEEALPPLLLGVSVLGGSGMVLAGRTMVAWIASRHCDTLS